MKENAGNPLPESSLSDSNQIRQALFKRGALQNAILNSENFSSIATDEKGVIQLFNVGAERMLGYTASEVVDKLTPADISDSQEVIARAKALSLEFSTPVKPGFESLVYKASRGIEDIYQLTKIRKDGSRFPAVVSVTSLRDAQGRTIGYLLIGTDNTARKQAEAEQQKLGQRLREQELYTRSLIDIHDDALITIDPLGSIKDVNNRMEALTGCTRGELLGEPFQKYFADKERAEAIIELVLREQKVTNYELTVRTKDGREAIVSCNATVLCEDKNLQSILATVRDMTDYKRLAQRLHENNIELENSRCAADTANKTKSDFLANMSHELRTPLNSILGFSELLTDELFGKLNGKQKEYAKDIYESGKHLLALINDILDLAKVESGKMELELSSFLLKDVLNTSMNMLKEKAMNHNIKLTLDIKPDADIEIEADERKFKQIMFNLLSNAVKFTPDGGSVQITARKVTPPSLPLDKGRLGGVSKEEPTPNPQPPTPDGDFIEISVTDTGIGIKAEDMPKLFKEFSQVESAYTRQYEGTGLGLALTKKLVELHEGKIWVESEFGKGSTFTFSIPVNHRITAKDA